MGSPANLWLIVLAVAVAVGIGFLVPLLVELRRSAKRLTSVLTISEESLPSLLRDMRITLHHMDRVAGDMEEVTGDVRGVTRSVRQVGTSLALVSGAVSVLGLGFGARAAGMKAGLGAGALYLAKHLFTKGART
jgi:uncharacterized protein YoxC